MTNDKGLVLTARALMALIFLIAGTRKLLAFAATAGYFAKLGLPAPEVLVAVSIVIEIGGGILLLIGYRQIIVAAVLAVFTIAAALSAHQFWAVSDPQVYAAQLNNFLKNVAMVGGFLMVIAYARRTGRT